LLAVFELVLFMIASREYITMRFVPFRRCNSL